MVSLIKYGALGGGEKYGTNVMTFDGLSSDDLPVGTFEGMVIPNGSSYCETDTGVEYLYDEENATWYEQPSGGGGGGGSDNYNDLSNKPQIGGVTLSGNKSLAALGIASASDVSGKADADDVYTKTEVDTALAGKADAGDIPTVNDSTITIQKNGATVDSFTTNTVSAKTINITVPTSASDVSALPASTKYAGASTAGGAATSAAKLNTNAGSATQPVYFSGGVPVVGTYSLNKTVPADAVFTDTTYENKAAASGGSDVSLVTTGEKYAWNNKVDKVTGKGLSTNDYTDEDKTAVGTIGDKVDKVNGKGLSTNDFTNAYKTKVDNIHGLESNITSSTTIKAYVEALSKGHYTSFILYNSVPSDSPIASTNAFVEIIVYSATTSMVRLTPVGTTADNKFYVLTRSGGTWRDWHKFEGTAVT